MTMLQNYIASYILLSHITIVLCLTSAEISKFGTSGNFPASYVTVDSTLSDRHLIYASGVPDHSTEVVNPNTATNQNYNLSIPKTPQYNTGLHGCVPLGIIGITRTGVAIYNPLTGQEYNAVEGAEQETFDSCDGHASPNGAYHYHKIPDSCLYKGEVDEFIGVALDGFAIYGPNVSDVDHILTSHDLDECHGREVNGVYRYHATETWPYFLGCFKGVVMQNLMNLDYICEPANKSSSGWEDWQQWTWYLCNCPMNAGGDRPSPEECRPDNPNRPANCPDVSQCTNNNPPTFCYEICRDNINNPPPFCSSLSSSTARSTNAVEIDSSNDDNSAGQHKFNIFVVIFLFAAFSLLNRI